MKFCLKICGSGLWWRLLTLVAWQRQSSCSTTSPHPPSSEAHIHTVHLHTYQQPTTRDESDLAQNTYYISLQELATEPNLINIQPLDHHPPAQTGLSLIWLGLPASSSSQAIQPLASPVSSPGSWPHLPLTSSVAWAVITLAHTHPKNICAAAPALKPLWPTAP